MKRVNDNFNYPPSDSYDHFPAGDSVVAEEGNVPAAPCTPRPATTILAAADDTATGHDIADREQRDISNWHTKCSAIREHANRGHVIRR